MTLKKRDTAKMREIMAEQDIAAAKAMRRKKAAKLGMRIAGVSMLAGALLVVTREHIILLHQFIIQVRNCISVTLTAP